MRLAKVMRGAESAVAAIESEEALILCEWSRAPVERSPFDIAEGDLSALLERVRDSRERLPLSGLGLAPPVAPWSKIICLGLNYRDHVAETLNDVSANPSIFTKFADSLVGHGASIVRPRVSDHFDFEGELAVIIGKPGRHITAEAALDHVFGYTIMMDGSLRDYQKHALTTGKNFWRSGALGPWIVTADEAPAFDAMTLTTRLSGRVVQSTSTDLMICDVRAAIEYISRWTPLAPGDVISTGTPSGIGARRSPQLWMKVGDRIEVEVPGVGVLANTVVPEGDRG